jgi:hypothetical protein
MDILENIKIGLFLESDDLWLKWNSKFDELTQIASPEIIKWGGPYKELRWANKTIFNGLVFDVSTVIELDVNGNPNGELTHFRFFTPNDSEPHALAYKTRDHLIQLIGEITSDKSEGEEYYWAWERKRARLIVGIEERYSTVFHFHFELI